VTKEELEKLCADRGGRYAEKEVPPSAYNSQSIECVAREGDGNYLCVRHVKYSYQLEDVRREISRFVLRLTHKPAARGGVSDAKRVPCNVNAPDHGYHPENEKCLWCG
jgi:hypothetical protein